MIIRLLIRFVPSRQNLILQFVRQFGFHLFAYVSTYAFKFPSLMYNVRCGWGSNSIYHLNLNVSGDCVRDKTAKCIRNKQWTPTPLAVVLCGWIRHLLFLFIGRHFDKNEHTIKNKRLATIKSFLNRKLLLLYLFFFPVTK